MARLVIEMRKDTETFMATIEENPVEIGLWLPIDWDFFSQPHPVEYYADCLNWHGLRSHPDCECRLRPDACPVHGNEEYQQLTTRT